MKSTILLAAALSLALAGTAIAGDCSKGTGPKAWYRDGGFCDIVADLRGAQTQGGQQAYGTVGYVGPGGVITSGPNGTGVVIGNTGSTGAVRFGAIIDTLRADGSPAGDYNYGSTTIHWDGQNVINATFHAPGRPDRTY